MTPSEKPKSAPSKTLLLLLLPVALLTACAHNSPAPNVSPVLPPPPSLSTPLPSVNYSLTAAEAIKNWRARQMATRLMSEPFVTPGQE